MRNCNKISDKDLLDGFLGVEFTLNILSKRYMLEKIPSSLRESVALNVGL